MDDKDSRSHGVTLAELAAEFHAYKMVMDERDRRYEDRFIAMDAKTGLALTSSEKAVSKAEIATEKRFDAVNEFRGTLSDQATNLLPRAEAAAKFAAHDEKFEDMKREMGKLREIQSGTGGATEARATSQRMMIGIAFFAVTTLLSVVGLVILLVRK